MTFLVLVFSAGDIREARARFFGLMLLFSAAAALTATAATLPVLLLAWEIMGAASYALIGFWWRDDRRVSAGLTAFITTRTADVGLYVAAAAALAGGAGFLLSDLADAASGWRHVIAAGVLVAALGKAAQLPFSFWLSRAMEGPSPVSALLHSAAMVAMGGYLLLRTEPLLSSTGWASPVTAWAGAATALLLGGVAVAQSDLKQLLAASTAAQLGFVVMAAGVGSVSAGTAHLLAHAATKALLFLAAGAWLTALGTKQLRGLRGVARRWPVVGWSATIGALALAGVAPLSLWATKDSVLTAALDKSGWLYLVGLAAAALSAAYAGKMLVVIWRTAPRDDTEPRDGGEEVATGTVNRLQQVPLVVLAMGAAVLGLLAFPPLGNALARALGEDRRHPSLLEFIGSAVLALAVVCAAAWWKLPEPRWAANWLGLEAAATAIVVRPTLRLAQTLATFDDRVVDRAVTTTAAAVLRLARECAQFDQRVVDGAVEAFASQVRRFGELARRPQTGQLHQYYLQALLVLAAGIIVLIAAR
ncbi:MAG TPA: proton-conducting transporter membrane subunit [Kribbella sp.]|nr:proton-conducting transporter membrane subunit [Kribbella sp.]HET6293685.1 proton-conducting transporter membrane subunit [Kribbella sp.]